MFGQVGHVDNVLNSIAQQNDQEVIDMWKKTRPKLPNMTERSFSITLVPDAYITRTFLTLTFRSR